jgi:hypothetical protein
MWRCARNGLFAQPNQSIHESDGQAVSITAARFLTTQFKGVSLLLLNMCSGFSPPHPGHTTEETFKTILKTSKLQASPQGHLRVGLLENKELEGLSI